METSVISGAPTFLQTGSYVDIHVDLPGLSLKWRSRILNLAPGIADVEGPKAQAGYPVIPDGTALTLATAHNNFLCRIAGHIQRTRESVGRLVFRIELAGQYERIQKRKYIRVKALLPVDITVTGTTATGQAVSGQALDISAGGVLLVLLGKTADTVKLDDTVGLKLHLPGARQPIAGQGKIVRENPREDGRKELGIAFVAIAPDALDQVTRFVFLTQSAQQRKGLR